MLNGFSAAARKGVLIAVSIIAVLILALIIYIGSILRSDTIYKGITIENFDVSGMDRDSAREAVKRMLKERYPGGGLTIKYGNQQTRWSFDDISYSFHLDEAVDKAFSTGRTGSIPDRLKQIMYAAKYGINYEIEDSYDENKALELLLGIKTATDRKAENADISYDGVKIQTRAHTTGMEFDADSNKKILDRYLSDRVFDNIELEIREISPELPLETLQNIDCVISSFTTKFNSADINRSYNIKLACDKINNTLLMPGQVFSMNEALGPRTTENGYRKAQVIFKNELVPGTGGGVCQVTTTLYNAVLKACLKVVERSNHSMTLGYVKPSQDATIAEGYIDFRFENNMDYPVYIYAGVNKDTIDIRILGKKSNEKHTVKLVSQTLAVYPAENEIIYDSTIPAGETKVEKEARRGLRSALYREIYDKDNKLIKREKISEDYYKAVKGLLRVGTGIALPNVMENM